mmetsp:Transcript_35433/g.75649  ORF Transcript_35433/g.75649 Transcript_35433/m.75649 type:complete len:237 (+) Transcript_35433:695-1405(+)
MRYSLYPRHASTLSKRGKSHFRPPRVYEKTAVHQRTDARHSGGLVGRRAREVQARSRDALPHGEHHRSLPHRQPRLEAQIAARGRDGADDRVQIRGDLPPRIQRSGVHLRQGIFQGRNPILRTDDPHQAGVQGHDPVGALVPGAVPEGGPRRQDDRTAVVLPPGRHAPELRPASLPPEPARRGRGVRRTEDRGPQGLESHPREVRPIQGRRRSGRGKRHSGGKVFGVEKMAQVMLR